MTTFALKCLEMPNAALHLSVHQSMITRVIPILTLLACAVSVHAQQPATSRAKYNFNSDWLVKVGDGSGVEAAAFADADWKKVTLPYAWN
jgi:hypothetical protein